MIEAGIRAVFFDAVGTLLFPRVPILNTYSAVAATHETIIDDVGHAFRRAFGRQEMIDQLAGWKTSEEHERSRWRAIVEQVIGGPNNDACFAELWDYFASPEAWRVNPDVRGLLQRLSHRSLVLGIASNFDARLIGIVNALPELALLGDRCAISSLIGWRKPAAEFFRAVVAMTGYNANEVLYVGDDFRNDIEGATAAGLRTIHFDPQGPEFVSLRIRRLRDLLPD